MDTLEPLVNVVITTYNRKETLYPCIAALKHNLEYSNLGWIIADDGSSEGYLDAMPEFLDTFQVTNAKRQGVGKSKNLALSIAFKTSPYVLLLEDDWILTKQYSISAHVATLRDYESVGIIRLGYLGGDMTASYVDYAPFRPYWKLHQGTGVYIYSGQVSLRHQRFYESVGLHQEGISAGEEELNMCIRYNGTENAPEILYPAGVVPQMNMGIFRHFEVGKSLNNVQPESN